MLHRLAVALLAAGIAGNAPAHAGENQGAKANDRIAALADTAASEPMASDKGRETGLPLPRFVSLKSGKVNLRVGPGRKYAIAWRYERRGLPVEVIQEFDNWRRIRDADGTTGWVLHSLLSSRRTAMVAPWQRAAVGSVRHFVIGRDEASAEGNTAARLQPGLMASLERCDGAWCRLSAQEVGFWLPREQIWGVYPDERVED